MKLPALFRDTQRLARFSTFVLFLALIRSISEPFRLQYYANTPLMLNEIELYLYGAMLSALGLLVMTIAMYTQRYKLAIATCLITIAAMMVLKWMYMAY